MKFQKAQFSTISQHKRVVRSIWIIVIITVVPSIFLAIRIVKKAIFTQNARNYVQAEFRFSQTQVVNKAYNFHSKNPSIELLLIGQELTQHTIDSLRRRMHLYHLDSSRLIIRQGLNAKQEIDLAQIKASILEDVFTKRKNSDTVRAPLNKLELPIPDLKAELHSLYPDMKDFSLTHTVITNIDSVRHDTVTLFVARFPRYLTRSEKTQLAGWIKERTATDSVKMILEIESSKR